MSVTRSDASASGPGAADTVGGAPDDREQPAARDRSGAGPAGAGRPPAGANEAAPADREDTTVVPIELKALVVLTVAAGLVLRFVTRTPLWLDEALSVNIAQLPVGEIAEALRHDGHPPLYYLLLHAWMNVFGSGDVAVRALSGIISVATLPVAFVAGTRAGGKRLGWLALAVFALCPYVLRYATETRMYALVSLLVLVGYVLLDDIVRRGRDGFGRLAGLALVTALLLYSHYWALWLLGATTIVLALVWRRGDPATRRPALRSLGALVLGGVAYLPWLPAMLYQSQHTGTPWGAPVRPTSLIATTMTDFGGGTSNNTFVDAQLTGAVLLILVLLAVFGRAIDGRHIELDLGTVRQFRVEAFVVAATIVIALLVSYASASTYASRYAAVILPLVLVLVAGGLSRVRDRWVLFGGMVVLIGLFGLSAAYNIRTLRTQVREAADAVAAAGAQPGDVVVYCPDQLAPSSMRVMPAGLEHIAFPNDPDAGISPARVDWVDYLSATRNGRDPGDWARKLAGHVAPQRSIFVVWSGTYKTHEGICATMINELSTVRGLPSTLLSEDGAAFFEPASVVHFPPRP